MKYKNTFVKLFVAISFLMVCVFVAGCNQVQTQDDPITQDSKEPIIGQWQTRDKYNGQECDVVFTINQDKTAYYMSLGDTRGFYLTSIVKDTWSDTTQDGNTKTYTFSSDSGGLYQYYYNGSIDTLISPTGHHVYTRLDPIVGIWSGQSSPDPGNASTLIKNDGTGLGVVSYSDGTVKVGGLKWTKKDNNQYEFLYDDGDKVVYTIDDSCGNTLTTEADYSKNKCFTDSSYLVSIIGPWYNAENKSSVCFNADGTGFCNNSGQLTNFNWKIFDLGKFEIKYKDGTDINGANLSNQVSVWTYDRYNNMVIDSQGNKFNQPKESVTGLISVLY